MGAATGRVVMEGATFMHHLNGCNGKLGEGLLGAVEKLKLAYCSSVSSGDATKLASILKRTKIVSLKCGCPPPRTPPRS